MKKIIMILSIITLAFFILSCKDEQNISYDAVLNEIAIGYQNNDSDQSITQDIVLPTSSTLDPKATFSWMSSHPEIISITGDVNQPTQDTTVYLSLTLKVGQVERIELFTVIVKGSITYYTVTFVIDETQFEVDVEEGQTVLEPTNTPQKDGYVIEGWFLNQSIYDFDTPVTQDLTLHAEFEENSPQVYVINTYLQNLHNEDYTRISVEQKVGQVGEEIDLEPTLEGFHINETLSILSGTLVQNELKTFKVYFERNTYSINYYVLDQLFDTLERPYGTIYHPHEVIDMIGYYFVGWYLDPEFKVEAASDFEVTESVNLYAKTEPIPVITYDINIYQEDLVSGDFVLVDTLTDSNYLGNQVFYNESIEGFVIDENQSTTTKVLSSSLDQSLEIYYERQVYDVTFYHEDSVLDQMSYKYETLVDLSSVSYLVDGYTFNGWYSDETLTEPVENITLYEDTSIYGDYELIPIVSYDINIFRQNINDDEYTLYQTTTLEDEVGTFVFYHETVEGFNINEELSNVAITLSTEEDLDINVYYDRNVYTALFMDGSNILGATEYRLGQLITPIADPEKEDYTFLGWTRYKDSDDLFDFNVAWGSSMVLYPIWEYSGSNVYTGYYASLSGLADYELKSELTSIITPMNDRGYTFAITILQQSDKDPNNANNLILVYMRISRSSVWASGANGTWNREHVWPQSKLESASPSDVHNLKPSDPQQNSLRGNAPFGGDLSQAGYDGSFWFPGDQDKGDIARIVLYMNVRWGLSINVGSVGSIDTFLRWHIEDPVDDFERNRNDVIYSYQNNRNPFIDHPELVERIWGPAPQYSASSYEFIDHYESFMVEIYVDRYIIPTYLGKENYIA